MTKKLVHSSLAPITGVTSNLPARIKAEDLRALVVDVVYRYPESSQAHSTVTICELHLVSGFVVVGVSGCVHPNNFSKELGESAAYDQAFNQLWELEGYRLRHAWAEDQLYYRRLGMALAPVTFSLQNNQAMTVYTPIAQDQSSGTATQESLTLTGVLAKLRAFASRLLPVTKSA